MDALTASPQHNLVVKVDLTAAEETVHDSLTPEAPTAEDMDVVAEDVETPDPLTEEIEVVEPAPVESQAELASGAVGDGGLAKETCGGEKPPPKKPRALRKKKSSAKAIAQAEQEKELAKQAAEGTSEDAPAAAEATVDATEAVGDDGPPPLIEVKKATKSKAPTPKAAASKPSAPVKPSIVLPAAVQDKIGYYHQKASALAEELETLQSRYDDTSI